jgi:hypothetical protein
MYWRIRQIWDKVSRNNFPANDVLHFSIVGQDFSQPYLLADGIYPKRPFFARPMHQTPDESA